MARLVTLGGRAPRADRMPSTRSLALTTAMRMINRVHGNTAHGGTDPAPALGAGLAQLLQRVFIIAHLPDGRPTIRQYLAHFPRAQAQGRMLSFARHQLHPGP